jgi:DNA mismatch repair ATPase MutS
MQQYLDAKRQAGDALLLFRLGDFYELFYEAFPITRSKSIFANFSKRAFASPSVNRWRTPRKLRE